MERARKEMNGYFGTFGLLEIETTLKVVGEGLP